MPSTIDIGFVGAGNLATALATALARSGRRLVAISSRRAESARRLAEQVPGSQWLEHPADVLATARLVFLAVPDDRIAAVCASLPWRSGLAAVHCSGAASLDVLQTARAAGAAVGAFHPLQTFAAGGELAQFEGVAVAIEAEEPLRARLFDLARAVGGRPFELAPADRRLYHAAAVLASNYTVTLLAAAADLWRGLGFSRAEAVAALVPLLEGTVRNARAVGLPHCLTGPVARGDVGTVRQHLEDLARRAPDVLAVYAELGRQTVPLAVERGQLAPDAAAELVEIFEVARRQAPNVTGGCNAAHHVTREDSPRDGHRRQRRLPGEHYD